MFKAYSIAQKVAAGAVALLALVSILLAVSFCSERGKGQKLVAEGKIAQGQAQAGKESVAIQAGATGQIDGINTQTRENQENIRGATNANDTAGEAGERLSAALCSRRVYRDHPDCQP